MDIQKFNRLELKIENKDGADFDIVNVYIDGQNLLDTVTEFEKKFIGRQHETETTAGAYSGDYPSRFIKNMQFDYAKDIAIFVEGGDMIDEDWDLLMSYDTKGDTVIWFGFHQPWRDEDVGERKAWDYSNFPTFIFDKSSYKKEMERVLEYCAKEAGDTMDDYKNYLKTDVASGYRNAGFYS